MKTDFDEARDRAVPGKHKTVPGLDQGPVSKNELEYCEWKRAAPAPAPGLTIGGQDEQSIHEHEARELEARINHIRQRLTRAKDRYQPVRSFNGRNRER